MEHRVIAAVKDSDALSAACKSNVKIIFELVPNITAIGGSVQLCRENDKLLFVHMDLAEGIGKDKAGLQFVKEAGVSGIISTRTALIKAAKELGLKTVQRVFILDAHSIETAQANLKTKPDMVEIMPGVIPRAIERIHKILDIPIIAGGLIQYEDDINAAIAAGATAVSTSMEKLWR